MENDNPNWGRHARQPEKQPIEPILKRELLRSGEVVMNVLSALTHTGQEGHLRDIRIEEIEKLKLPVSEYLEFRDQEAADNLHHGLVGLVSAQKAVVDTHLVGVRDLAIQEIIEDLTSVGELGFHYRLSPSIAKALDIQHETVEQLKLLGSVLLGGDEPITRRIISIKIGVDAAFTQNNIAPLRFIKRGLDTLAADAKEVDEQMTNMPEKNEAWKKAQSQNNKLRQLLTQFT
jgi:hypothetical protein